MRIIYIISKLISLPGSILKGFWEHIFCRAFKSPVESSYYIRMDELCGHVEHELAQTSAKSFWINFLSGWLNFLAGIIMAATSLIYIFYLGCKGAMLIPFCIILWIGLSLTSNIFPTIEDALNMWEKIYSNGNKSTVVGKILYFIPALVMMIGAYLEAYGLTVLINIAMVVLLIVL